MENTSGTRLEWPTLAVAALAYAGFAATALLAANWPLPLAMLAGAVTVTLHGSLQHEAVHGHPTASRWLNRLLVLPNLWLWLPFEHYRRTHLAHHRKATLTVPSVDPESPYVSAAAWRALPAPARLWLHAERCLFGAMLLRPFRLPLALALQEWREPSLRARDWLVHGLGCALPLWLAMSPGGLALWQYIAIFVLPGIALTTLRSFAEHGYEDDPGNRTNVTLCRWPLALLFLNNNLHTVHHLSPGLAWYRLPSRYRELRRVAPALVHSGEVFAGYAEVARRFGLRPRGEVVFPATSYGTTVAPAGGPARPSNSAALDCASPAR